MLSDTVEADETYIGGKCKMGRGGRPGPKDTNKAAVIALAERDGCVAYHDVSPAQLHRYLNEFDFRYNAGHVSDGARIALAPAGAVGKLLKYADS
jgi:hypothetical protein